VRGSAGAVVDNANRLLESKLLSSPIRCGIGKRWATFGKYIETDTTDRPNQCWKGAGASTLEEVERNHILRVFRETGGVVSLTATRLAVPRTTLNTTKKLGISRKDV
jgi:transcriptional regulator with GAF, ATPase, and Fis domain